MPTPAELAIVICSRERADLLRSALVTVRACTPPETSVIVVDSASTTTATREVVREAGVEYVRTDIKGLSIARNVGLAATQRPFVLYTDDDCEAVPGWTSGILAAFDPEVGAVTGTMLDHALVGVAAAPEPARRMSSTIDGIDAGHGALMAFRRTALVELGGFDEVLGAGRRFAGAEDLDMFCRVLEAGWVVVHDPTSVVHHVHTREDPAYVQLYQGYGLGLGAMGGKWLRIRFRTGARILAVLAGRTLRRAFRARGDRRRAPAEWAMLRGIVAGTLAVARAGVDRGRLIDHDPPAPIVLAPVVGSGGSR
jgi:glycosyltransferase involved in cell wall biosynthesis